MLYQTPNPHGGDVYGAPIRLDFSANINPLGLPPSVISALTAALPELSHYPDPYCRRLVQAIAQADAVCEKWILCGNGAAELIYAYANAVKPKSALLLSPTFCEYAHALQAVGCQIETYPLSAADGFAVPAEFLAHVEKTKPELIVLCNPNNPTGRLCEHLPALAELCKKLGIRLFVDECFLPLSEGRSLAPLLAAHPELFLLRALTKSYALAGLRLGYGLCTETSLLHKMAQQMQPWNVSVLAQAAGVAALKETDYLQTARALIGEQRNVLQEGLTRLNMRVCPSDVNFLLFYSPKELQKTLLRQGIAIRSCENEVGAGWYRIAVRTPAENQQLLAALQQIVSEEIWQNAL